MPIGNVRDTFGKFCFLLVASLSVTSHGLLICCVDGLLVLGRWELFVLFACHFQFFRLLSRIAILLCNLCCLACISSIFSELPFVL